MISGLPFRDRREAGQILAAHVRQHIGHEDAIVFALPRGGVPIGLEVARELDAPLDVCVVRKLIAPGQPGIALGAIATGGYEALNLSLVHRLGISPFEIAAVADRESNELQRREERYRGHCAPQDPHGRLAVIVDDGLATGCTMRAAIGALRDQGAHRIVIAVPVGSPAACAEIASDAELICALEPDDFDSLGAWYRDYPPTSDDEVVDCLAEAARGTGALHALHT